MKRTRPIALWIALLAATSATSVAMSLRFSSTTASPTRIGSEEAQTTESPRELRNGQHDRAPTEESPTSGGIAGDSIIVDSTPVNGTIDARAVSEVNGIGGPTEPITIVTAGEYLGEFTLCESAEHFDLGPNSITKVIEVGEGMYEIQLAHPIAPNAVTRISADDRSFVEFIAHPGNVNGDSAAGSSDVLVLLDVINGTSPPLYGLHSADINHSGDVSAADVLTEIDVLNLGQLGTLLPSNVLCSQSGACPGEGDCFMSNGSPGCSDVDCCNAVCAFDPFCCDQSWDSICADEAVEICRGGGTPDLCKNPRDCDDGISCTIDNCDTQSGLCTYIPQDRLCDDGQFCNGVEVCDSSKGCLPGDPVDCDDGDLCTEDDCDEMTGKCENLPNDCDDNDPCTDDSCNLETGECMNVNNGFCDEVDEDSARSVNCCTDATGTDQSFHGDPVYLFSGEFHETFTDLRIPGRGFDFAWTRTYRSKIERQTPMGYNWDHSYNIYLEASGANLAFFDGTGRRDVFLSQPNGTWTRREYFREIEADGQGGYLMTHRDTSTWTFSPVAGAPAGRYMITAMVGRNGNTMTFGYDTLGRLITISDTLNNPPFHERVITIAYDDDGQIESVSDWAGRQVKYAYYSANDDDGGAGDLKSMTSPAVVSADGTPWQFEKVHEYPDGKTSTYAYTTGFADERLNHDMVSVTDPKGQTYVFNYYAHTIDALDPTDPRQTTDPADPYFDRVVVQVLGGDRYDWVYKTGLDPDDPGNNGAVTAVFVNNRAGDVKAAFYDAFNRVVIKREYAGRAIPDQLTDLEQGINLPGMPEREGDPMYPDAFETLYFWNDDSLMTKVINPEEDYVENTYDVSNPNRRSQANLLDRCLFPGPRGSEDQPISRCESFKYDDNFGGCCGTNFVTEHTDFRGHTTLHFYDPEGHGNRIKTIHRIPTIVEEWEYNDFGQVTLHIHPDNGGGHLRKDEFIYYDASTLLMGYLRDQIIDVDGFALRTSFDYDVVGNRNRVTDPRGTESNEDGHDTLYTFNQLNQVVQMSSRQVELPDGGTVRYITRYFYDANDNLARIDVQNIDEDGVVADNEWFTTIHEFDILNDTVRTCQEAGDADVPDDQPKDQEDLQLTCDGLPDEAFIHTEYQYDANKNRSLIRFPEAVEERQPANVTRTIYDERDLVFKEIRADLHPESLDPDQSTTQYDYDANRNLVKTTQGTEGIIPRVQTTTYDGYDRAISRTDPMGNVSSYHYDENSNLTSQRTDGELADVFGSSGNVRLSEGAYAYDDMDRQTQRDIAHFDAGQNDILDGQSTTTTIWSDNSQGLSVEDDNDGHITTTAYDTANRASTVTDAKGNTVVYEYDANSNVTSIVETEKSDLGRPDEQFTTQLVYDALDRQIKSIDNVGNTNTTRYDSRNNVTTSIDALGNVVRNTYDGLNRLLDTTREITDTGDGNGTVVDTIVTKQEWDDDSRLRAQIDDAGNATTYGYDPVNRMKAEVYADGTARTFVFDVHHNRIQSTDANGNVVDLTYDLNDRLVSKVITPGPGVSQDTTAESFQYDGLSRLISAEDNDSSVTREYDSLSNVTAETLTYADAPDHTSVVTSTFDGDSNKLTCTYPGPTGNGSQGRVITTSYDELDRKKTLSDQNGQIAEYFYVGPGRVERRTYGNGTQSDFTYDGITGVDNPDGDFAVKRIVETMHTRTSDAAVIDHRTFTWDKMYNKTSREDVRAGGPRLRHGYSYDSIYRLVHTNVTDQTDPQQPVTVRDTQYNLDGVHNRLNVAGTPEDQDDAVGDYALAQGSPLFDHEMNQYTETPLGLRIHDLNGNLTKIGAGDGDGSGAIDVPDFALFVACRTGPGVPIATDECRCFDYDSDFDVDQRDLRALLASFGGTVDRSALITYDYRNQMVEYADLQSGQRHEYFYDALGRRVMKIVNADAFNGDAMQFRYLYDGWQIVEEQSNAFETRATWAYGLYIDEVLTMRKDVSPQDGMPEDYYYHTDDLYNVMALTDADGAAVERYEYADYGAPTILEGFGSEQVNPWRFTGRQYDGETALHYYRTRYLTAESGQFTTRDTLGAWRDVGNFGNPSAFVGLRSLVYTDPFGQTFGIPGLQIESTTYKEKWKPTPGHSYMFSMDWDCCEKAEDRVRTILATESLVQAVPQSYLKMTEVTTTDDCCCTMEVGLRLEATKNSKRQQDPIDYAEIYEAIDTQAWHAGANIKGGGKIWGLGIEIEADAGTESKKERKVGRKKRYTLQYFTEFTLTLSISGHITCCGESAHKIDCEREIGTVRGFTQREWKKGEISGPKK